MKMNRKPKFKPQTLERIPYSNKPGAEFRHHVAQGQNVAKTHHVFLHATKGYKCESISRE